jgi:protein phosphatase
MGLIKKMMSVLHRTPLMAGHTDPGCQRERNEDAYLVAPELGLMGICDGMGGHNAGTTASRQAVETLKDFFDESTINRLRRDPGSIQSSLIESCIAAHRRLRSLAEEDNALHGMGSTVVLAFINVGVLHVAHVGDSRAYLCHDNIELLTEDHSYVMQMVKAGRLSLDEARHHPDRNWINQALGGDNEVSPGYGAFPLSQGDRVLLCSDGLWDMLPGGRIQEVMKSSMTPLSCCEALVSEANAAGGEDNITVCTYFHTK